MEHRIEPLAGIPLRRLAALASIVGAVLLIAVIVGGAQAAAASPFAPASHPGHGRQTSATAEPEEEVEWEWSEEEEEEVELEFEEGEEEIEVELEFEEQAPRGPSYGGSTECALQSASARVVASEANDTLHLSLLYTSRQDVRVDVHYSAEGARSAARPHSMTLRRARHGRVDRTERPGARRMSELRTARVLVVTLEVPGAPGSCRRLATRRLISKRHGHGQTVWSEAPRRPRRR